MAIRFDKELLIKHHFWILLGTSVLLVFIALIMLPSSVGSVVEKEKGACKSSQDQLKNLRDFKNGKWVDAYEKQDKIVVKKKDEVWGESWDVQKDMMTWPADLQETWSQKYPYF